MSMANEYIDRGLRISDIASILHIPRFNFYLNCLFDVKYSEPRKHIDPRAIKPKMVGYFYATKVD